MSIGAHLTSLLSGLVVATVHTSSNMMIVYDHRNSYAWCDAKLHPGLHAHHHKGTVASRSFNDRRGVASRIITVLKQLKGASTGGSPHSLSINVACCMAELTQCCLFAGDAPIETGSAPVPTSITAPTAVPRGPAPPGPTVVVPDPIAATGCTLGDYAKPGADRSPRRSANVAAPSSRAKSSKALIE